MFGGGTEWPSPSGLAYLFYTVALPSLSWAATVQQVPAAMWGVRPRPVSPPAGRTWLALHGGTISPNPSEEKMKQYFFSRVYKARGRRGETLVRPWSLRRTYVTACGFWPGVWKL
uniref:Putative secreted protein n=1 Tax=Ixodes ricinus TaxID=34613 RepID=A0A6B0UKU3_IXORI